MRYLLLIYGNAENWRHPLFLRSPGFLALTDEEQAALARDADALRGELVDSGELLAGVALDAPMSTRTVRVRDGLPYATDGPYQEAKEHLAGYLLLEVASESRALEIAARVPDARFGAVELRPLVDVP